MLKFWSQFTWTAVLITYRLTCRPYFNEIDQQAYGILFDLMYTERILATSDGINSIPVLWILNVSIYELHSDGQVTVLNYIYAAKSKFIKSLCP